MPADGSPDLSEASLADLVDRLLRRDRDAHAAAVAELATRGDERVVPHLVELVVVDAIANDWARFGFPEVLREHCPPRYLDLPEVAWPGVGEALAALAEPSFDADYAWVEWESWYSQQDVEPLDGFDEWKRRLYRSYLPPVGSLLDVEPRTFDLQDVRWGNCDRSYLAALNQPDFVPGAVVDAGASAGTDPGDDGEPTVDQAAAVESPPGGDHERYLRDDDLVFGFVLDGRAYAVPRWVLFPHELLNATLGGVPVSLTFCTLCNAPILYDRRVGAGDDDARGGDHTGEAGEGAGDRRGDVHDAAETLTFGSTGMLLSGNKVMYDEETESLWSQHRGVAIAGEHAERGTALTNRAVTQADWADWKRAHPDTRALAIETGFDWDYRYYDGDLGIFRHYWENEAVVQPGVRREDDRLPEKAAVYGVTGADPDRVVVFPVDAVRAAGVLDAVLDDRPIVAVVDRTGDVAVYEAPPLPAAVEDGALVDDDGTRWTLTHDALVAGDAVRPRVAGRHGLWFAFRSQYADATVVDG